MTKTAKPDLYLVLNRTPDRDGNGAERDMFDSKTVRGRISLQLATASYDNSGDLYPASMDSGWDAPYQEYVNLTLGASLSSEYSTLESLVYAHKVGFTVWNTIDHPLDLRAVELIAKAAKALRREFARAQDTLGYPKSFGQWVQWHLGKLPVKGVIIPARGYQTAGRWGFGSGAVAEIIDGETYDVALKLHKAVGNECIPATR